MITKFLLILTEVMETIRSKKEYVYKYSSMLITFKIVNNYLTLNIMPYDLICIYLQYQILFIIFNL